MPHPDAEHGLRIQLATALKDAAYFKASYARKLEDEKRLLEAASVTVAERDALRAATANANKQTADLNALRLKQDAELVALRSEAVGLKETLRSYYNTLRENDRLVEAMHRLEEALAAARRECEGLKTALRRVLEIRADPAVLQAPDSVHDRLCELADVVREALVAPAASEEKSNGT